MPYLLILPVVVAIGAVLGYPLYNLVRLSFEKYGLFELIQRTGQVDRARQLRLRPARPVFWDTLVRTVVFTIVNVGLTMVLGTLIALLLVRVSPSSASS